MYNPFNSPYGYPQMPQLPQMNNYRQSYSQPQFVVKQVTNIEEARASMIDPLSTYLFVDTSTGNIYLKRLNNNGLSDFFTYKTEQTATPVTNPLDEINTRLTNIENKLGGLHVQSIPSYTNDAESKSNGHATASKPESTVVQQGSANGSGQVRNGTKTDGKQYR